VVRRWGHQLGAAITGFTPLIAGALSAVGGWPLVAAYFTLACLVSALCVFLATETFRKDIAEMEPVEREVIAEPRVQWGKVEGPEVQPLDSHALRAMIRKK
jgi:nitrate/nitrite transporter NarK